MQCTCIPSLLCCLQNELGMQLHCIGDRHYSVVGGAFEFSHLCLVYVSLAMYHQYKSQGEWTSNRRSYIWCLSASQDSSLLLPTSLMLLTRHCITNKSNLFKPYTPHQHCDTLIFILFWPHLKTYVKGPSSGTHGLHEELGRLMHGKRGGSDECPSCGVFKESVDHVLFECASYDSQAQNFLDYMKQILTLEHSKLSITAAFLIN